MKEVGWETLVLSFGSGFRYEMKPDDPYIATLKANVMKATAMGIEVGGCKDTSNLQLLGIPDSINPFLTDCL